MREEVKRLGNDDRKRFKATVKRFGTSGGLHPKRTIMIADVVYEGVIITDHLWFNMSKFWKNVKVGDMIEFDARVKSYTKGYKGYNIEKQIRSPIVEDWKLAFPTKLSIIDNITQYKTTDELLELGYAIVSD